MSASRRTRAAACAAALSAALVIGGFAATAGSALAAEDLDCSDFDFQEDAQKVLDADRSDPNRLDGGPDGAGDGVACESLPRRGGASTDEDDDAPRTTAPAGEDDGDSESDDKGDDSKGDEEGRSAASGSSDRDCADFSTQAEAQAALAGSPDDRERLDSDGDGVACEQHFGTEGRQVAVHPRGGVSTGGTPRP